ncbi:MULTISPECIES: hypothetical protein [unclassified Ruminococcus]|uniref:hypothetical protein n=1 Tax=unclassified Ruminococcus TaxID=2608920 RepID=UPI00210BF953|nr:MULTISPECIES: hypothetical protein [unclassified Ruminococcus]MCQ4022698.1 hypothetical protein [Ruminococcus sp. zg-924]MCQ4114938.1 hypothetical protein [Ruminococcus sp. zg-921]
MKNDLIERYIYALVKRLPEKKKEDISNELRGLIDDMLLERCGDLTPTGHDVRVVLTELGNPYELAEKYSGNGKNCLIGAPYYSTYKFVLKIVLICVVCGITCAEILSGIFSPSGVWYFAVGGFISAIFVSSFQAFAFVTLLFAFFYHKDIKINTYGGVDSLPPVPKKNEKISRAGSIIGICFSVVFLIVFLFAPQIFCVIISGQNLVIPILNAEVLRECWYILVMFALAGIVREIIRLIEGRYNFKVMLTTAIANTFSIVLAICWLLNTNIMSNEFLSWIPDVFSDTPQFIISIFNNFQLFLLVVILFAILIDTVETVVRYIKSR